MNFITKNWKGIFICLCIAVPSWFLGNMFPIIGGAVIAIIAGMVIAMFLKNKAPFEAGIKFTSKKILQWAVPIIVSTITISLVIAFVLCKVMHIPGKISTLVGVGSSICGGSAIAATAPVIDADDEEVAQAISVIFFFNVLAAIFFPTFGKLLGFSTATGEAFGIFAGTAVNDTSSVTAAASTWDTMWGLGSATLDTAVTVKLTRTLAIIPITLVLAFLRSRSEKNSEGQKQVSLKQILPMFILYFVAASVITTIAVSAGVKSEVFSPIKTLSKFFIVLAMSAIGLNTDIVKLVKTGGKPIFMGFCCWTGITGVSLLMQHLLQLW